MVSLVRSLALQLAGIVTGIGLGTLAGHYLLKDTSAKEVHLHNNVPNLFEGRIIREDFFEPQQSFGLIYRIEVESQNYELKPFVFIGHEEELKAMNRDFNVNDRVRVHERGFMYSLDLERVLTADCLEKQ